MAFVMKKWSDDSARSSRNVLRDERGLTTVEYIIVLMLIAIVGIVTWQSFGETLMVKLGIAKQHIDVMGGEVSGDSSGTEGSGTGTDTGTTPGPTPTPTSTPTPTPTMVPDDK